MRKTSELIEKSIKDAYQEFSKQPFDFMFSEREALFLLYSKLIDNFREADELFFNHLEFTDSKPAFSGKSIRIRLETKIFNGSYPDVVILSDDVVMKDQYARDLPVEKIDSIIEVKIAFGFDERILSGGGVDKDVRNIIEVKSGNPGYFVYFWASRFSEFRENEQRYVIDKLNEWKNPNIQLIFIDGIKTFNDKDKS